MADAEHPLWRLLQTISYLVFATVFLWLNASSFDRTEMKTLIELAVVMLGSEFVRSRFVHK